LLRRVQHREITKAYPGLIDAVSRIGGIQIQGGPASAATCSNALAAADTIPALNRPEAVCSIAGPKGQREVPVENFCVGPAGRLCGQVNSWSACACRREAPIPVRRTCASFRRNEMDIAVVGAASASCWIHKSRCTAARVALAAVAPTPLLVPEAGAGSSTPVSMLPRLKKAANLARAAAKPISDMRATPTIAGTSSPCWSSGR